MGHLYVFQLPTKQLHRFPYHLESLQNFCLQVSQTRTREVYVNLEGKKRLIPTVAAFFRTGKHFSEVVTVHDKVAFDRIPTGDPVSE